MRYLALCIALFPIGCAIVAVYAMFYLAAGVNAKKGTFWQRYTPMAENLFLWARFGFITSLVAASLLFVFWWL